MKEYREKERIEATVKYVHLAWYERKAYGYGNETVYIYMFDDEDGQRLVWKTTSTLLMDIYDEKKEQIIDTIYPTKKSIIRIKGTVKAHEEYNGREQVVLSRVKLLNIIQMAKTPEEIEEEKRNEQMKSLQDGDELIEMEYMRYKNHYSDCETLVGSFIEGRVYPYMAPSRITVIVRKGRMKNSGVRGKHFDEYFLINEQTGHKFKARAVSEENAIKQAVKEYGHDGEWRDVAFAKYHSFTK